jgi:hypothetical protein
MKTPLTILVALSLAGAGARTLAYESGQPAEIALDCREIYPSSMTEPSPVGIVDENPPFLHFQKKYDDDRQRRKEKLAALFYFRMARSVAMKDPVFESGARRWSFYCPYKRLEKGAWYWQCGFARKDVPGAITWSDVFSFTIGGSERATPAPPYEVLEAGLLKNGHPRIECRAVDVGKLKPDDPKLARQLVACADAALAAKRPSTFMDFSRWDNPQARKSGTSKEQKASYLLDDFERFKLMPLVRGYLLTGDCRYRDEALACTAVLLAGYRELQASHLNQGFVKDTYGRLVSLVYDALYNELDPGLRANLRDAAAAEAGAYFETLLDEYEHVPYNEHRWQSYIRSAFVKAMGLVGETPEASEWMRYLYDLWNFKEPGAGRNDGGWFTGTGYFTASGDTLFIVPYLLSQHTGANFFDRPWYGNVGRFLCYSTLPDHPSEGFGDNAGEYRSGPIMDDVRNLRYLEPDNPWNHRYLLLNGQDAGRSGRPEAHLQFALRWYELQLMKYHPDALKGHEQAAPIVGQAAFFPDTGFVAMCSDADNLQSNAMVNFRSCPFGQFGHAHAAQNAFNLTWQGRKLFFHTGYYTSSNDPFSVPNYKHSRAHNTILADGIGQSMAHSGYGWVPRFLNGGRIAYCLGDASTAYTGEYGPYGDMLKERGVEVSPANGYGNPGVTRFRRHLVFLRPHTLVVYDELEARQPVTWTFRLNSPETITKVAEDSVAVQNGNATATAKMFTRTGARSVVTDRFFGGPAVDFLNKLKTTRNEWHADLNTASKTAQERLLTIIRINPGATDPRQPLRVTEEMTDGMLNLVVDGWKIAAQMDADKPSLLTAADGQESTAVLTGSAAESIGFAGQTYRPDRRGMTLLLERNSGKITVRQAADQLPDAAIYGNLN